jgi:hypothetical protein
MLGLFSRSAKPASPFLARRACLGIESLEARDCPTVGLTAFSVNPVSGQPNLYSLSGHAIDSYSGARITVTFGGVLSGSVVVDSAGNFSLQETANPGTGTAVATDNFSQNSSQLATTVSPSKPVISDFTITGGDLNVFTLHGTVTGAYTVGQSVVFSGCAALNGQTATVQADGTYSLTIYVPPAQQGCTVYANLTDSQGQAADQVWDVLTGVVITGSGGGRTIGGG